MTTWIYCILYAMVATFIFEMLRRRDIEFDEPRWHHVLICAFAAAMWPALILFGAQNLLQRKRE